MEEAKKNPGISSVADVAAILEEADRFFRERGMKIDLSGGVLIDTSYGHFRARILLYEMNNSEKNDSLTDLALANDPEDQARYGKRSIK